MLTHGAVTLALGCANTTLSAVSPVIISSNGSLNIGGVATRLDVRIGFWGECFSSSRDVEKVLVRVNQEISRDMFWP